MKVSKTESGKDSASARKAKQGGGHGAEFADKLRQASGGLTAGAATELSENRGVAGVDALIAVQEAPDATAGRSRGLVMRYGGELLDSLDAIHHALLMGSIPKHRLSDLAAKMRARAQESQDPRLEEIIHDIELRAAVEIAKLTRKLP